MAEQARVLVVDDDPVLRKVLQGMLAQDGIPCLSAGSAPEALEVIDRHEIAVMVTDLKMPGMDGLELLERALNVDPSLQAILVTAHGTGATAGKPGRFELAEGGTLFLDEIGDLSPATQVKLLRVLQDRQFERLGGTETRTADVRILSATHRDLEALCREGKFREDLFYRINVVPVLVPPLRERLGDVRALAEHFFARFCREHQKPLRLRAGALDPLEAHPWPGNVRELQNVLERLVVLNEGALGAEDVARCLSPASPSGRAQAPAQLEQARAEAERTAIEDALRRTGGNRTAAARVLGISRRTLYNKMLELQMS